MFKFPKRLWNSYRTMWHPNPNLPLKPSALTSAPWLTTESGTWDWVVCVQSLIWMSQWATSQYARSLRNYKHFNMIINTWSILPHVYSPGERLIMTFSSSYQLFMKSINTTGNPHPRETTNWILLICVLPTWPSEVHEQNLWSQFIKAKQCNTNTKKQEESGPTRFIKIPV